jgi:hypothetical protein
LTSLGIGDAYIATGASDVAWATRSSSGWQRSRWPMLPDSSIATAAEVVAQAGEELGVVE